MMPSVRILNRKGEEAFTDYINEVKTGHQDPPPVNELGKPAYSQEFPYSIEIPNVPPATTRIELGTYLFDLFENYGVPRDQLVNAPGMWSWLPSAWPNDIARTEVCGHSMLAA